MSSSPYFQPEQVNLWRCTHTRESQVEIQKVYRSLIPREKGFSRVTGAHEAVLDYSDLFRITLHGDDIQNFDIRWDEVSFSISLVPDDSILDSLSKMRIRESD